MKGPRGCTAIRCEQNSPWQVIYISPLAKTREVDDKCFSKARDTWRFGLRYLSPHWCGSNILLREKSGRSIRPFWHGWWVMRKYKSRNRQQLDLFHLSRTCNHLHCSVSTLCTFCSSAISKMIFLKNLNICNENSKRSSGTRSSHKKMWFLYCSSKSASGMLLCTQQKIFTSLTWGIILKINICSPSRHLKPRWDPHLVQFEIDFASKLEFQRLCKLRLE